MYLQLYLWELIFREGLQSLVHVLGRYRQVKSESGGPSPLLKLMSEVIFEYDPHEVVTLRGRVGLKSRLLEAE